jgi:hypothetical protein
MLLRQGFYVAMHMPKMLNRIIFYLAAVAFTVLAAATIFILVAGDDEMALTGNVGGPALIFDQMAIHQKEGTSNLLKSARTGFTDPGSDMTIYDPRRSRR